MNCFKDIQVWFVVLAGVLLLTGYPNTLFAQSKKRCTTSELNTAHLNAKRTFKLAQQGHKSLGMVRSLLRKQRVMIQRVRLRWKHLKRHLELYNTLKKIAVLQKKYTMQAFRVARTEIREWQHLYRTCPKRKPSRARIIVKKSSRKTLFGKPQKRQTETQRYGAWGRKLNWLGKTEGQLKGWKP